MGYRDDRTKRIFKFICQHEFRYGYAPTLSEIAEEEGFKSNGGVLRHLDKLEKWGWIERHHTQARSIRILRDCGEFKFANEDNPLSTHSPSQQR